MDKINSAERLVELKEYLLNHASINHLKVNEDYLNSIQDVKKYLVYATNTNILNKSFSTGMRLQYSDQFINYIIDTGFKSARNFEELADKVKDTYVHRLATLMAIPSVTSIYREGISTLPLEVDYNVDVGILIKYNGKVLNQEVSDIYLMKQRIEERRDAAELEAKSLSEKM